MRISAAAAALLTVPAALAVDAPPFPEVDVWDHLTDAPEYVSDGGVISGFQVIEGSCESEDTPPETYPGVVVSNFASEEGYASRVLPVVLGGDFVAQGYVAPARPGPPTDPNFFGGIEVDQLFPPGSPNLTFYFAGVRPAEGGMQVFASRDGDSDLGSTFLTGAQGAHVRIFAEEGQVFFETRACPADSWFPFASTPLTDPAAFHTVGLGGSNLDAGAPLFVGLTEMQGTPPAPVGDPSIDTAFSWYDIHKRCLDASIHLGKDTKTLPDYQAVLFELTDVIAEINEVRYSNPFENAARNAARAASLSKKAAKAIAKCEALAEKGKALAAQKATLKALKTVDKAATATRGAFLPE